MRYILQEATQANRVFAAEETVGDRQKVVDKAWAAKIIKLTPKQLVQWRQATQSVE